MTQELIDKLIAHYEWCVKEIEGMGFSQAFNFLTDNAAINGICKCAYDKFNVRIYGDEWVESLNQPKRGYWRDPPFLCPSKETMITALQFRIDRMKTFKP